MTVHPLNVAATVTRLRTERHCPGSLALAAAELDDGQGQGKRVAKALGLSATSWDRARVVLKRGSPELVAKVRSGEVPLATAWKSCLPQRAQVIPLGPRIEAAQVGEKIVDQLDAAVTAITSFPTPEDVAAVLRRRHDFDRERVARAATWMRRLSDVLDI